MASEPSAPAHRVPVRSLRHPHVNCAVPESLRAVGGSRRSARTEEKHSGGESHPGLISDWGDPPRAGAFSRRVVLPSRSAKGEKHGLLEGEGSSGKAGPNFGTASRALLKLSSLGCPTPSLSRFGKRGSSCPHAGRDGGLVSFGRWVLLLRVCGSNRGRRRERCRGLVRRKQAGMLRRSAQR